MNSVSLFLSLFLSLSVFPQCLLCVCVWYVSVQKTRREVRETRQRLEEMRKVKEQRRKQQEANISRKRREKEEHR